MKISVNRIIIFAILFTSLISCELINTSECGSEKSDKYDAYGNYFSNPSDIYWGVSGGVRYYTYNFTFGNICPQQNPKLAFFMALMRPNTVMTNPFTVTAGTYTCIGVQPQKCILTPNEKQDSYTNQTPSEIGMTQCFSGQASATIYPYITVSFNTLGSSKADSIYLINNLIELEVEIDYRVSK